MDAYMSEKQAELEDVEIEVDLKSSSMTAMHESMMIAEKQKIIFRRQTQQLREIKIRCGVEEPLTSTYKTKKNLEKEGYTPKKVLKKFSQREGLLKSRFRKDGVKGLAEL